MIRIEITRKVEPIFGQKIIVRPVEIRRYFVLGVCVLKVETVDKTNG